MTTAADNHADETTPEAGAQAPAKRIAIVVADGFEQSELEVPRKALLEAGFAAEIVSPVAWPTVRGAKHADKGDEFAVDRPLSKARPQDYAGLLLPGGVHNPDTLRRDPKVLDFVRHFVEEGKPIAAICHGPWTLIDAGAVSGRAMTSYASIKTDLINAGASWRDEEVVIDQNFITSRSPQDLPAFCKAIVEAFQQAPRRSAQQAALIAKLGELIADIRIAMLTTTEPDGSLRSRPMATLGKRFDGTVWFFTSLSSPKSEEAAADPHVNVSYAEPKASRYVSMSGRAKLVRDRQKAEELWHPLVKVWFPKGLEDPDLGLMRIEVEHAEYWDAPAGKTLQIVGLAKSLLTRSPYRGEGSQHEAMTLEPPPSVAPAVSELKAAGGASRDEKPAETPAEKTEKIDKKAEKVEKTDKKADPGGAAAGDEAPKAKKTGRKAASSSKRA